jgi:sulfite exporter TauE/SafE
MFIPSMKQVGIAAAVLIVTASSAFAATVATNVELMSGPGDNYNVVSHLNAGAAIKVLNEKNDWCRISEGTNRGWVPCTDIHGFHLKQAAPAPVASTPTAPQGYDFEADPYLGPTVLGSPHSIEHHSFS